MPHILLYSVHSVAKKKKKSNISSNGKTSNKSAAAKDLYNLPLDVNPNHLAHENANNKAMWPLNALRATTLDNVTIKLNGKDVVVSTSEVAEETTVDISRLKSSQKKCGSHGQLEEIPALALSANIIYVLEAKPFEKKFDLTGKQAKRMIAQANKRGDSDPELCVKWQLFQHRLCKNGKMYMWEGYHLALRPCTAAAMDRMNGVTPDITGAAFDPNRKIVFIHPNCTRENVRELGKNAVENPEWWPKSWN